MNKFNQPEEFKRKNKKRWLFILITVFLLILFFGAGLFVGNVWSAHREIFNKKGVVDITKVINLYSKLGLIEKKKIYDELMGLYNKLIK